MGSIKQILQKDCEIKCKINVCSVEIFRNNSYCLK